MFATLHNEGPTRLQIGAVNLPGAEVDDVFVGVMNKEGCRTTYQRFTVEKFCGPDVFLSADVKPCIDTLGEWNLDIMTDAAEVDDRETVFSTIITLIKS